jgi:hypothetical protein
MGQKFSDFSELRDAMARWPRAANSVMRMGEMRINEMTTE